MKKNESWTVRGEKVAQKCMRFLVDYGENLPPQEKLIDLDGTVDLHPGTGWVGAYDITREEVAELAAKGERFKFTTFSDKAAAINFIVDGWVNCCIEPYCQSEYRQKQLADLKPYIDMGMVPTFSCNHYLVSSFWPHKGQHSAWVESSAVPYCNAILGSPTNFDGCSRPTTWLKRLIMICISRKTAPPPSWYAARLN